MMLNVTFFLSTDCCIKFTNAFHREQEHNFAGIGISDSAARLVRVRIGAVVSPRAYKLIKKKINNEKQEYKKIHKLRLCSFLVELLL